MAGGRTRDRDHGDYSAEEQQAIKQQCLDKRPLENGNSGFGRCGWNALR